MELLTGLGCNLLSGWCDVRQPIAKESNLVLWASGAKKGNWHHVVLVLAAHWSHTAQREGAEREEPVGGCACHCPPLGEAVQERGLWEHKRACPWDWPSWALPGEVGSLSYRLRAAKTLSPSELLNGRCDRFMCFCWRQCC